MQELYRAVENACMHRLASSVYNKLSELCRAYVVDKVDSLLVVSSASATIATTTADHASFLAGTNFLLSPFMIFLI